MMIIEEIARCGTLVSLQIVNLIDYYSAHCRIVCNNPNWLVLSMSPGSRRPNHHTFVVCPFINDSCELNMWLSTSSKHSWQIYDRIEDERLYINDYFEFPLYLLYVCFVCVIYLYGRRYWELIKHTLTLYEMLSMSQLPSLMAFCDLLDEQMRRDVKYSRQRVVIKSRNVDEIDGN